MRYACEGVPIVPLFHVNLRSDLVRWTPMTGYSEQELLEFLHREFSVTFDDKELLRQAFTRRSYFNEPSRDVTGISEETAFLGDAVLQVVVSETLYTGGVRSVDVLTNRRKEFVTNDKIAEIVGPFRLTRFLRSSQGERSIADSNTKIIATTFEALVGAVFLDKGYHEVARFVRRTLMRDLSFSG